MTSRFNHAQLLVRPGEATLLVLVLPLLILCWAIAIAAIAAVVR